MTPLQIAEKRLTDAQAALAQLKLVTTATKTDIDAAEAEVSTAQAELDRLKAAPAPTATATASVTVTKGKGDPRRWIWGLGGLGCAGLIAVLTLVALVAIVAIVGLAGASGGAAWYFWPAQTITATVPAPTDYEPCVDQVQGVGYYYEVDGRVIQATGLDNTADGTCLYKAAPVAQSCLDAAQVLDLVVVTTPSCPPVTLLVK
ncbi:MAG: hypothetical protein WCT24_03810 [Patescibacteria group bacterium]|jgi:hypothetical protein